MFIGNKIVRVVVVEEQSDKRYYTTDMIAKRNMRIIAKASQCPEYDTIYGHVVNPYCYMRLDLN